MEVLRKSVSYGFVWISMILHGVILLLPFYYEKPAKTDTIPKPKTQAIEIVSLSELHSYKDENIQGNEVSSSEDYNNEDSLSENILGGVEVIGENSYKSNDFQDVDIDSQVPLTSFQEVINVQDSKPSNLEEDNQRSEIPIENSSFLKNFPEYPEANPGLPDLLNLNEKDIGWHTQDPILKVTKYFDAELESRGFNFNNLPELKSISKQIYQVNENDKTAFLHIFSYQEKTVILLSYQVIDLDLLASNTNFIVESSLPERFEFDEIVNNIGYSLLEYSISSLRSDDFDHFPDSEKLKESVDTRLFKINSDFETTSQILTQIFKENGFTLDKFFDYNGGNIYLLQKNSFELYLGIIPADSMNSATGVFTLTKLPE